MRNDYENMGNDLKKIICDVIGVDRDRKSLKARLDFFEDHHTNPGDISRETGKQWGETTYQRCFLFNDKAFYLQPQNREVRFIDGELPVVFSGSSRRKSVDLVGKIDDDWFLCELKYHKPGSPIKTNSPQYALLELATYYYQVLRNQTFFEGKKIKHKNKELPEEFWKFICDHVTLLVLGNQYYWDKWGNTNEMIDLELIKKINACFSDESVRVYVCEADEYLPVVEDGDKYTGILQNRNLTLKIAG